MRYARVSNHFDVAVSLLPSGSCLCENLYGLCYHFHIFHDFRDFYESPFGVFVIVFSCASVSVASTDLFLA